MDLTKYISEKKQLSLKVIPNAVRTEIVEDNGLRLYLQAVPEKGKANQAVIKFFKKKYGMTVRIIQGTKSREKVIAIID